MKLAVAFVVLLTISIFFAVQAQTHGTTCRVQDQCCTKMSLEEAIDRTGYPIHTSTPTKEPLIKWDAAQGPRLRAEVGSVENPIFWCVSSDIFWQILLIILISAISLSLSVLSFITMYDLYQLYRLHHADDNDVVDTTEQATQSGESTENNDMVSKKGVGHIEDIPKFQPYVSKFEEHFDEDMPLEGWYELENEYLEVPKDLTPDGQEEEDVWGWILYIWIIGNSIFKRLSVYYTERQ